MLTKIGPDIWFLSFDKVFFNPDKQSLANEMIYSKVPRGHRLVLSLTWEYVDPIEWLFIIRQITADYKVSLVLDTAYLANHSALSSVTDNVLYVDFFALKVHYEVDIKKSSTVNAAWNPDSRKFLFLTGKPDRVHRIGLLHRFYTNSLLEHAEYSLFVPPHLKEKCRRVLKLDPLEFDQFVSNHARSPDGISPSISGDSIHYGGFPYDSTVYANTLFRVVSETLPKTGVPWITEKTWTTIANCHPFIIVGDTGTLRRLSDLGFETFASILPVSDYDSIQSINRKLQAAVDNTRYLLQNINTHRDYITQGVRHNQNMFRRLIQSNMSQLESFLALQGAQKFNIYRLLPFPDMFDTWPDFYYNVKGESWPDCYNENDFDNLPDHIKKECIEVFGYKKSN